MNSIFKILYFKNDHLPYGEMYGVFDLPLFVCYVQINIQVSCTKSIASLSCNFIHMARFVELLNHRSEI